jgi:hypothetical protein
VALVRDGNHLWVASMVTNTVEEVSEHPLRITSKVSVPAEPSGFAILGGQLWISSVTAGEVTPLNLFTGQVGTPVPIPGGAVRIAAGFGSLWVTGTMNALTEVHPSGSVAAPTITAIKVGTGPIGVTTGDGSVWVANAVGGTVVRVNPTHRTITQTFHLGGDPLTVAVSGGRVWVADGSSDQLRTIFPQPVLAPVNLKSVPRQLLAIPSGVWVASANPGRVLAAGVDQSK